MPHTLLWHNQKEGEMRKGIALGIVGLVAVIALGSYNGLVTNDELVNGSWSEVQNQLKRRNDLVPNLVETVKGYAGHEKEVFSTIAEARSKLGGTINVDASKLAADPAMQKQLAEANQTLSQSLGRLLAIAENYPVLKADQGFLKLQDELAGTENRIGVARGRAITATKDYNRSIRQFPTILVARFGGFTAKEYYAATEAEQQVPKVSF